MNQNSESESIIRGGELMECGCFGGIDSCFFFNPVEDCTTDTLIPLIKQYIRPGTKIMIVGSHTVHSRKKITFMGQSTIPMNLSIR